MNKTAIGEKYALFTQNLEEINQLIIGILIFLSGGQHQLLFYLNVAEIEEMLTELVDMSYALRW